MSSFYNSEEWKAKRSQILERDDYACQQCGFQGHEGVKQDRSDRSLVVHHIKPKKEGGDESLGNLKTVCAPCHVQIEKTGKKQSSGTGDKMNEFNGFDSPYENWSKLPHQFIGELPNFSNLSGIKIVLYVLRHTWGYGNEFKKITIDEFMNGRKRSDGTRIDNGTGLSKPSVVRGCKWAVGEGYLYEHHNNADKGRSKKYYSLTSQGLRTLTSDVNERNIQCKESLHRTEKETRERKQRKKKPDELPLFPEDFENLNVPEFLEMWADWKRYKKSKILVMSYNRQLKKADKMAAEHGVSAVCGIFDDSITNGWAGLFWKNIESKATAATNTLFTTLWNTEADPYLSGNLPFSELSDLSQAVLRQMNGDTNKAKESDTPWLRRQFVARCAAV